LSKARENLISAETSKKHFEDRVEELTRQLQGAEEKLSVYDRRGAPATTGVVHQPDPSLPRDEQLEAEVADLRYGLQISYVLC
jgi:nucleoprotein TPR